MLALAIKLVVILGVLSGEAAGQSTLVECDSGKIALTSVPFMKTPAADACGANALGGKSIRSIFEFSVTPPDTIAKMVNTPSCQTWWSDLSAPFALFKPCTYLGMSIQDFSNMPLQEFLEANNQEILLSFGPNQPADTSPMEIDDKGSAAPPSPRCDSGKIAVTSVPFMTTPAADACGAEALGGKSIRSIFESSVTPPDTIAKMVNTPSCQTWWSELSAPFALFKPCMYLGTTIQDFSKQPLQAFLEANNKEIQSFDPNRPADTSPVETDDEGGGAASVESTTEVPPETSLAPPSVIETQIALTIVPTYDSADAVTCAAATLNGKDFNSLFETTPASDDTIKAVSAHPGCNAWYSTVATAFAGMDACEFLGRNVQEYGKLSLTEFLVANNKEIQSFDPSKTLSPVPTDTPTSLAPTNTTEATTVPKPTPTPPATTKASSAAGPTSAGAIVLAFGIAAAGLLHM
ncbi:hypothetical protein DYB30_010141 [Aphanomyces astaci]|uniref:Uncharacterized protein n=1 Tax=Aphanomyces astaci TaxID=112090 RepID=A0A397CG88_APHAT|nr:hypothetical protein DYB30_010141 [Aphanomyces astaci]